MNPAATSDDVPIQRPDYVDLVLAGLEPVHEFVDLARAPVNREAVVAENGCMPG